MTIEVQNLSCFYGQRQVLEEISFTVQEGELVSIMGANGVGKSTLFRCMLGLCRSYQGKILWSGSEVGEYSPQAMAKLVAYIPQTHYPSFNYSVFDMVLMGTSRQVSLLSTPKKEHIQRAERAIETIGISHLIDRSFFQISGGERQLTLMARALAQDAKAIILDEPTANLDYGNQIRVLDCMRRLTTEGYIVIQATHHPEQAYLFSQRILALKEGRLVANGSPQQVLTTSLMTSLYGIPLEVESLHHDRVRVCVPSSLIQSNTQGAYGNED